MRRISSAVLLVALAQACAMSSDRPTASAALDGWSTRFHNASGVRIEFFERAPTCETARLAPIVLVPGMTGNARTWLNSLLVKRLATLCPQKIVLFSFRGRGGSEAPVAGWTPEDHAADLLGVLRASAPGGAHVVAHSMGVGYALAAALEEPNSTLSFVAGDYYPGIVAVSDAWVGMVAADAERGTYSSRLAPGVQAEQGEARSHREFAGEALDFTRDYSADLSRIAVPILVVLSHAMPPGAEGMYDELPRRSVHRFDTGHAVFDDAEVVEAVVEHLARSQSP